MCEIHKDKIHWADHVAFNDSDQFGLVIRADLGGLDMRMTLEGSSASYLALADKLFASNDAWSLVEEEIIERVREKFPRKNDQA